MRVLGRGEGAEVGRLEDALDDAPDVPRDGVVGREDLVAVFRDELVVRCLRELRCGSARVIGGECVDRRASLTLASSCGLTSINRHRPVSSTFSRLDQGTVYQPRGGLRAGTT